eukprot:gene24861-33349_t
MTMHVDKKCNLLQESFPISAGKGSSIAIGTLTVLLILICCPASFSFSLRNSNVIWQRTKYFTLEAIAGFGQILPPWKERSTIFDEREEISASLNMIGFQDASLSNVQNATSISLFNIEKADNYSTIRDYEENNYLTVQLMVRNITASELRNTTINYTPDPILLIESTKENSSFMSNLFAVASSAADNVAVKPIFFVWGSFKSQIGSVTKVVQNNVATPADDYGVYVPKGLFGMAARLVRRRVLNILDRSPTNWAHALSQDGDSVVRNLPAIYVSRSEKRFSMNRRSASVGDIYDEDYDSSQSKLGRLAILRRMLSSVRQDISKRLGGGGSSTVEAEFNIFGGRMSAPNEVIADRSSGSSNFATKNNRSKASELINSASMWFRRMVLRRSGTPMGEIISGDLVPNSQSQSKEIISSRQEKEVSPSSLPQESPNPFLNPLMGVVNDLSGMFKGATHSASSIFHNAQLEFDRRLQWKADNFKQNITVTNKEVTAESFRNLVQAGAEMADFSRSRILKTLGVAEESKLLNTGATIKDDEKRFRWPWEVFYRAEIPFFETEVRSSSIESEEDSIISRADNNVSDVSPQEVYSDFASWNAATELVPSTSNVPVQVVTRTKIDKHILQRILHRIFRMFPVATFIFGSLISIFFRPFQRKEADEDEVPKKTGKLAWQPMNQNDGFNMDDLKYNPSAATNVPFPLITENIVSGTETGAMGLLKSSSSVVGASSQVLTSLDIPQRSNQVSSTDSGLSGSAPMPFLPSTTLSASAPVNNPLDMNINDALDNVGRDNSIRKIAGSIFTSATAQIFSIAAIAMNDVANLLKSEQRQQKIQSQPLVMIQSSNIPASMPANNLAISSSSTLGEVRSNSAASPVDVFGPSDNANFMDAGQRTQEVLRTKPAFIDKNRNPLPTKADFAYIKARQVSVAIQAALNVQSEEDVNAFLRDFGLKTLMTAIIDDTPTYQLADKIDKLDVVRGVCRLTREKKSVADEVARNHMFIGVLCDFMEAPLKRFELFQSQTERDYNQVAQKEATALMQRMIRSSDLAVNHLRNSTQIYMRLMKCFDQIIEQESLAKFRQNQQRQKKTPSPSSSSEGIGFEEDVLALKSKVKKKKNSTTIVEYKNLKVSQMSRVASWGLGGVQWRPKLPGQKGLRILSLDGGGTRGVLSISYLKEIFKQSATSKQPHEFFDIICGTSTGGIIAVMLGSQRLRLPETEALYDRFIDRVTEQAFYDETELENVLYEIVKDDLMLDSNQNDCCRVFCISTKVNNNPPQTQLWRNYNYPPGQSSRYPGAFRVNTLTAVRATTAAPTFFTPVQWEGGLFCDGALVANNPTAIALQEAKVLYPGIPVELVVSIGTGYIDMGGSYLQSMGWDLLVNNLIASSTNTEDVHALLVDFLPKDKYFRFNPQLRSNLAIDEKNKSILTELKQLARDDFQIQLNGPNAPFLQQLFKTLRADGT